MYRAGLTGTHGGRGFIGIARSSCCVGSQVFIKHLVPIWRRSRKPAACRRSPGGRWRTGGPTRSLEFTPRRVPCVVVVLERDIRDGTSRGSAARGAAGTGPLRRPRAWER